MLAEDKERNRTTDKRNGLSWCADADVDSIEGIILLVICRNLRAGAVCLGLDKLLLSIAAHDALVLGSDVVLVEGVDKRLEAILLVLGVVDDGKASDTHDGLCFEVVLGMDFNASECQCDSNGTSCSDEEQMS